MDRIWLEKELKAVIMKGMKNMPQERHMLLNHERWNLFVDNTMLQIRLMEKKMGNKANFPRAKAIIQAAAEMFMGLAVNHKIQANMSQLARSQLAKEANKAKELEEEIKHLREEVKSL